MSELEMLTTALAEAQAENARLERRVDELLKANNAEVERRRAAEVASDGWRADFYATDRRLKTENARLQRALDAAQIVRGNDPTLPDVAVEREEIEGA